MSPITRRDFQSSLPLEPATQAALSQAFEIGWVEAQKIHHQSAQLRIKLASARESIAANLGVREDELEFVGELGFGFWSAISGLLVGARAEQPLIISQIDRQIVHAFARQYSASGGRSIIAPVSADGRVDLTSEIQSEIEKARDPIVLWQATNRETGVEQNQPEITSQVNLFADMTARFDPKSLPESWDVALWDPRSFAGPEGLAILAIKNSSSWRSPIPPMDNRRLFGSFSKPLLIATAIALESWCSQQAEARSKLAALNQLARELISMKLPDAIVVGSGASGDPRNLAIAMPGVIAEELLRDLERAGFLVDAGSACGSGALSPSHVMDALGHSGMAHIRITLKSVHQAEDLRELFLAIAELVK